jgi:hypothetical protein
MVRVPSPVPPALNALHRWLDSWAGIGAIISGMASHGYDLALTSDEQRRRATFLTVVRDPRSTDATMYERPEAVAKAGEKGAVLAPTVSTVPSSLASQCLG